MKLAGFVHGFPVSFQRLKPPCIEMTFVYPSFASVSAAIADRTPPAQ